MQPALAFDSRVAMTYALTYANSGRLNMQGERPTSPFRNGRNQALRIPREFDLPGSQAPMRKEAGSLVITPIETSGLLAVLAQRWSRIGSAPRPDPLEHAMG